MDLVRVLITGPAGTPYGRGCFIFDIFYPVSYPTNPPLVVMTTTGGGTVRYCDK
jgi:baculoviral IAP repeat-containing protein 6